MRPTDSGGLALPLLLLLLLVLSAFGHAALVISRQELQAVWAFSHHARAGAAAEVGLRLAWDIAPDSTAPRVPWMPELLVDGRTEDGLLFQGTRRWLNDEYFLVEGIGGSHGWEGKQREAWIGWTVAPAARVRAFLSYAGLNEDSEEPLPGVPVDPLAADDPEGWPSSLCDPYRPLLDTLVAEGRTYFLSEGDPAFRGDPVGRDPADPGAALPSIGLWSGQSLLSLISEEVETGARSVPANSLGCSDSARPVLSGTLGTLSLSSGRFCGLMVVGGDFRLGGDAKFQGLALVGGDMILQEDANFEGMLKVGNRFFQRDRASFRLSFCPVVRALDQIPALMRPILVKPG